MKKAILTMILLSVVPLSYLSAQPYDTLWTRTYGGAGADEARCVQWTSDGGYIIAGRTQSFGAGGWDCYLVKTDSNGDIEWTRTFGGGGSDEAYYLYETNDGGYVIAGRTDSEGGGLYDFWLIRTDSEGNALWRKTYGGANSEEAFCVQQTYDNGFIMAGDITHANGYSNALLIKTDSAGNAEWVRAYGGDYDDGARSVCQTPDGGYIIAGDTYNYGAGLSDIYVIKIDTDGDTIWTRTYGGSSHEHARCIRRYPDSFVIVGSTESFGSGYSDFYLIKTDSIGDTLWTRTFYGVQDDYGAAFQQTIDGGYIIAGWTGIRDRHRDICLIKTLQNGDFMWRRIYGGAGHDAANFVQLTSPRFYMVAGYTESFGAGDSDFWLLKVDVDRPNDVDGGTQSPQVFSLGVNYPNPFNSNTVIPIEMAAVENITLSIYNLNGQLVTTLIDDRLRAGKHIFRWEAADMASGIYFYRLTAGGNTSCRRMSLVK
jgi:regulation of enolase protein 1 (concanavalin A-like superfamily)